MKAAVENARAQVANLIGAANASEVVFTSCGSESDNWAIGGFLEQNPTRRHIITTRVEHEAVRNLCEHLEQIGCEVTWLDVDGNGELDLDQLRRSSATRNWNSFGDAGEQRNGRAFSDR